MTGEKNTCKRPFRCFEFEEMGLWLQETQQNQFISRGIWWGLFSLHFNLRFSVICISSQNCLAKMLFLFLNFRYVKKHHCRLVLRKINDLVLKSKKSSFYAKCRNAKRKIQLFMWSKNFLNLFVCVHFKCLKLGPLNILYHLNFN